MKINTIPQFLYTNILKYLSTKNILKFRLVCKCNKSIVLKYGNINININSHYLIVTKKLNVCTYIMNIININRISKTITYEMSLYNELPAEDINILMNIIKNNKNNLIITKLYTEIEYIYCENISKFLNLIIKNVKVLVLKSRYNSNINFYNQKIFSILKNSQNLQKLILYKFNFKLIVDILKNNNNLHTLENTFNIFTDTDHNNLSYFCKYLETNDNLKILNLNHNLFSYADISSLHDMLIKNNSLLQLYLGGVFTKNNYFFSLAPAFNINNTILDLTLNNNNFNDDDAVCISENIIMKNKSIKKLNLSYNKFGYVGLMYILYCLQFNNTLENISLIIYKKNYKQHTLNKLSMTYFENLNILDKIGVRKLYTSKYVKTFNVKHHIRKIKADKPNLKILF